MRRLIKSLLFSFLVLSLISCDTGINDKNSLMQTDTSLEDDFAFIEDIDFSGIVLIENDGEIKFSKSYGYKDLAQTQKVQIEDPFVIGSISKQITAALIIRDFEAGYLDLKDPIGKYLLTLPKPWKDSVTIHQLLVHTSGITDKQSELFHPPGAEFHYSQFGYQLLAEIIESIHHNSFENLANLLFDAKGLKHTHYPTYTNDDIINSFELNSNQVLTQVDSSLENYPAAGSFISTASDLAKWNTLLYSGEIVSLKGLELMSKHYETRNHPIFGTINYGYGLTFLPGEHKSCIGALGYAPGFASANFYYPETKTSLIVLSNKISGLPDFKVVFEKHLELINFMK